jgi:hypothetical protein
MNPMIGKKNVSKCAVLDSCHRVSVGRLQSLRLKGLTRIRLQLAIYFLAFPGRSAQKAAWRELCRIILHFESAMIRV